MNQITKEKTSLKALYLEDSPQDIEIIRELLLESGFDLIFDCVENKTKYVSLLQQHKYDIILSDFTLPGFNALKALEISKEICPGVPFICISGSIGEETAIELIKNGAVDYVLKDRVVRLPLAIKRALNEAKEKDSLRRAEARFKSYFELPIVGIAISSTNMEWIEVNSYLCQMLGYSRDELLHKTWLELTHPDDRNKNQELFNKTLRGEIDCYFLDKRFIRKNGKIIWTSLSVRCIRLDNGNVDYFIASYFDITDRKRFEEKVLESEEKYRSIYENSSVGILLTIPDGNILSANDYACKLFGMTEEELCQLGRNTVVDSADSRLPKLLEERKRIGKARGELTFIRKDGTKFEGEISSIIFLDKEGKERTSMVIQDLTERKKAETALRESEIKYRTLITQSPDGIFLVDLNGDFLSVNKSMCEGLNFTEEEFLSMNIFEIVPGQYREQFKSRLSTILKGERVNEPIEYEVCAKDGTIHYIEILSAPYYKGDKLIGFQGIARETTERKRAEDKISEQARLLEIAMDAIIVRDMEDRLLFWNKAAEKLYGWTFEEACSNDLRLLVNDEDIEKYKIYMQEFLRKGEWEGELHKKTKNNRIILTHSRWTLVRDKEGKPSSRLIIDRDITEQRELEAKFRRAQRLENLGTLAGGIAHDLNNVLAPILMATQVLEKRSQDPQIKEIANALETNTLRGRDIIKQVLMFARGAEEGFAPQQLKYIIDEMRSIIRETFPRNISLRINVTENLQPILGDATQLHQVLMNLCVNARDAMPTGGILKIIASNVILDKTNTSIYNDMKPGEYVLLTVSDNGTGIPKELQEKVFDPFFTTKEVGKGTGLGLSTVHGIVRDHKGYLKLSSEVGKGTEFNILFPIVTEEKKKIDTEKVIGTRPSRGETILLVDDEITILQMCRETLELYGYNVITARNGSEALSIFDQMEKDLINLVVMDFNMPVMDGISTITAFSKIEPNIKIILSSGTLNESEIQRLSKLNIKDRLIKPYTAQKLLETISSVLTVE